VRKSLVAGGIAIVAVFAGVIYFARDTAEQSPAAGQPAAAGQPVDSRELPAAQANPDATAPPPVAGRGPPQRPATSDPRLSALMVSPDNALIEFIQGSDGRVIQEIDNDPSSAGYRKPLREYTYAGSQVVALAAYKYLGDQIQVTRVMVTYKPDGSVDQYRESTTYDYGKNAKGVN
jgi:hypothetical protein